MIRVIVDGAAGKMGKRIINLIEQDENLELVGAVEYSKSPYIGKDIGEVMGLQKKNVAVSSNLEDIVSQGEVIIEFSSPEATLKHTRIAANNKKAMVIGTTGLSDDDIKEIKKLSVATPIMMAPNMSLGVNILFKIVEDVAKMLDKDYDIEIVEMHHRLKKDAPSGTALKLAEYAAKGLGENLSDVGVFSRNGIIGERKEKEIGVMSLRGGDVVGDHTVIFAGSGERLEFTHKASSRDTFAIGAVRAAKWVVDKLPGLYDMKDVLGIK